MDKCTFKESQSKFIELGRAEYLKFGKGLNSIFEKLFDRLLQQGYEPKFPQQGQ